MGALLLLPPLELHPLLILRLEAVDQEAQQLVAVLLLPPLQRTKEQLLSRYFPVNRNSDFHGETMFGNKSPSSSYCSF